MQRRRISSGPESKKDKHAALGRRIGPEVSSLVRSSEGRVSSTDQKPEHQRVFAEWIVRLNAHKYARRCHGKPPFTIA
jgi:hypothetical protein